MHLLERGFQWDGLSMKSVVLIAIVLFGLFTISHTTHLYVMLTITSAHSSQKWVYAWWRHRFLVDAVITGAVFLLST